METSEILKKVRKIEIKTRGLSQNIFAGQYHSAFKGRGMAFSEVREYQFGDDVRDIDWNVTARFRKPFVKVFEEERELTVMLMIDVSGSLSFGTRHCTKSDMAVEKGRKHILYIIREMLDFKPQSSRTDIGEAMAFFTRAMKRRATVFVLSDFLDKKDFLRQMQIASRKHDIMAIQVYDGWMKKLPDVGLMRITDAETGHEMYLDTSSRKVQRMHAQYWAESEAKLKDVFSRSKIDWVSVATNDDYVRAMMRLFGSRI